MMLVEYGGGGRRSFIFIPEETEGKGWRRMVEALLEFAYEGRSTSHNRGEAPMRPLVAALQLQKHSYREVLMLVQSYEIKSGDGGDMEVWRGASARQGNGHRIGRAPRTAQWKDGGGRHVIGLTEGTYTIHCWT